LKILKILIQTVPFKNFYMYKKQICLLLQSCLFVVAQAQSDVFSKIEPTVLNAAQKGEKPDFFILFREQADVSAAQHLHSKDEKGEYVFQTLKQVAQKSQTDIQFFLQSQHIDYQSFWIVNMVYTRGDLGLITTLARDPAVSQIVHNPHSRLDVIPQNPADALLMPVTQYSWGLTQIHADSVWAMGIQGAGAVVGGADTGHDWVHPGLKKSYRGWNNAVADHNYNWHDAIRPDTSRQNSCGYNLLFPCDDNGHGTHTIGTAAGVGNDTLKIGVAPQARWIAARNMNQGDGTLQSYIECFEWFIAPTNLNNQLPDTRKAPHVINNSWYCAQSEGCNASNWGLMEQAIQNCRLAGIVPVVSVGNSGPNCTSMPGPPAFFKGSFSVGATRQDDTIARFSSRGPDTLTVNRAMKPDISAPGVSIISSFPNDRYGLASGTSMSGPHVAGVVALMISANPRLAGQVDTIEKIIRQTARPMQSEQNCGNVSGNLIPNNTYGFGRIDAFQAVKRGLLYRTSGITEHLRPILVQTYPNPVFETLNLQWNDVRSEAQIWIFDVKGQLMMTQMLGFEAGKSAISTAGLPFGMYFFKLNSGEKVVNGRFLKGLN
jgi:serine protease AprX